MRRDEMIGQLAAMKDDDPRLGSVAVALEGRPAEADDQPLLRLCEVSKTVRLDPSWLRRIGVVDRCGIRIAGRPRYRLSDVMEYLASEECRERVGEIREARKSSNS